MVRELLVLFHLLSQLKLLQSCEFRFYKRSDFCSKGVPFGDNNFHE